MCLRQFCRQKLNKSFNMKENSISGWKLNLHKDDIKRNWRKLNCFKHEIITRTVLTLGPLSEEELEETCNKKKYFIRKWCQVWTQNVCISAAKSVPCGSEQVFVWDWNFLSHNVELGAFCCLTTFKIVFDDTKDDDIQQQEKVCHTNTCKK